MLLLDLEDLDALLVVSPRLKRVRLRRHVVLHLVLLEQHQDIPPKRVVDLSNRLLVELRELAEVHLIQLVLVDVERREVPARQGVLVQDRVEDIVQLVQQFYLFLYLQNTGI